MALPPNFCFCSEAQVEKYLAYYSILIIKAEFRRESHTSTNLHKGHCGACSILQDLGVYMAQNLTQDTRRCGLEGVFLGIYSDRT